MYKRAHCLHPRGTRTRSRRPLPEFLLPHVKCFKARAPYTAQLHSTQQQHLTSLTRVLHNCRLCSLTNSESRSASIHVRPPRSLNEFWARQVPVGGGRPPGLDPDGGEPRYRQRIQHSALDCHWEGIKVSQSTGLTCGGDTGLPLGQGCRVPGAMRPRRDASRRCPARVGSRTNPVGHIVRRGAARPAPDRGRRNLCGVGEWGRTTRLSFRRGSNC